MHCIRILCFTVFTGCPYGPDDVWGITWPNAPGGLISSQPCPGGVDAVGMLLMYICLSGARGCFECMIWFEVRTYIHSSETR